MDELQAELSALVERDAAAAEPIGATFLKIYRLVLEAAGRSGPLPATIAAGSVEGRPRLTEPWFC